MKKLLLLTSFAALGMSAMATEGVEPITLEDTYMYSLSANGEWGVSTLPSGVKIFNFVTGQSEFLEGEYSIGTGKCISNDGVVVGSEDYNSAQYYKNGQWFNLQIPDSVTGTCTSNAISPDGKFICGSLGISGVDLNGDALMQVPVIWEAEGDGYGMPVALPYPALDFSGRVPMYVLACDISDDGTKVAGGITNATGFVNTPIVYEIDANGNWQYTTYKMPDIKFPEYPGEGPENPNIEDYMTEEEMANYNKAVEDYWAGVSMDFPNAEDFLSAEKKAEYQAAMKAYQDEYNAWNEKFMAWMNTLYEVMDQTPGFVMNSFRISPDGLQIGATVETTDPEDFWATPVDHTWISNVPNVYMEGDKKVEDFTIFENNAKVTTKYNLMDDLHLFYLGNNGLAIASTLNSIGSNSYVLNNGKMDNMFYWMYGQSPAYASWMNENMKVSYEDYEEDPATGEFVPVMKEELMTGRGTGTPDLSVVALSVPNLWDYSYESMAYVFDIKGATSGVENVGVAAEGEKVIYDLSGRKLNNADAPGIYVINGKKVLVK